MRSITGLALSVLAALGLGLKAETASAAADVCAQTIVFTGHPGGYRAFWRVLENGAVERMQPTDFARVAATAQRVAELEDGRGSFRFSETGRFQYPMPRHTEVRLDEQGRLSSIRVYSSRDPLPPDASLEGHDGAVYAFANRDGACIPVSMRATSNREGWTQPFFDADACARIRPVFDGVRVNAGLATSPPYLRVNQEDLRVLARALDENHVAPNVSIGARQSNEAIVGITSSELATEAVVGRAATLLRHCQMYGAVAARP